MDLPVFLQNLGWQTRSLLNISEIEPAIHDNPRVDGEWLFVAES